MVASLLELRRTFAVLTILAVVLAGCSSTPEAGEPPKRPEPKVVTTIPVADQVRSVAIAPDGRSAYVSSAFAVSVVDLPTTTVTGTLPEPSGASHVEFSRDGKQAFLVSGIIKNVLVVTDPATRRITHQVPVDGGPLTGVVAAPDGRFVYSANHGTGAVRIDTAKGVVDKTLRLPPATYGDVAISPDGRRLYITSAPADDSANRPLHTLSVIDTSTFKVTATVPLRAERPSEVEVSADGTKVYVGYFPKNEAPSGVVTVINATNNSIDRELPVGARTAGLALTPDSQHLLLTSGDNPEAQFVNLSAGSPLTIPLATMPNDIAITPDGTHAYLTTNGGKDLLVLALT